MKRWRLSDITITKCYSRPTTFQSLKTRAGGNTAAVELANQHGSTGSRVTAVLLGALLNPGPNLKMWTQRGAPALV
jgi:hypothetical protein